MRVSTRRIAQQIILFGIVLMMLLTHNSVVSMNVRLMMTGVALLALIAIGWRRLRDSRLLISLLDYGWLPYILLTGLTVLLAQSPRRSLEDWLWLIAIQLPIAYGALYIFRRNWPERGLYRAVLGAGVYFYAMALIASANYVSQWLADRAAGIAPPGFRLLGIMNHPNIFAMFIAISAPLLLGYVFTAMKLPERLVVGLSLLVAAFSLFGTGSRTGLVAAVIGGTAALALSLVAHPARPVTRFLGWASAHRRQATGALLIGGALALVVLGIAIRVQFGRPFQDDGGGRLSFFRSALAMFAERPLTGLGPGGFVQNEVSTHSVPPYHILPHAHDMLLNTAAESGILGLIGFVALLAVTIWICVIVWRRQPAARPFLAGPIGGLLAFSMFGILDSPISQFGPFFLGAILLSYVAARLPARGVDAPVNRARVALIVGSVAGVVLLCILVLIPYSVQWNLTRPDQPPSVDSLTAAKQLDGILAYDSTDPLVTFQSAYAWAGAIAPSDRSDSLPLRNAIARFERGLQLAPDLGIHYLNLSALYRQAGRSADAISAAQRSTEIASGDPVGWLNLGLVLEEGAQSQPAQAAYLHALQLEPRWVSLGFWQGSAPRQLARAAFEASPEGTKGFYALVESGDTARLAGKNDEALIAYQAALKTAPGPAAATYAQGLIAWASGDSNSAYRRFTEVTSMDIVYTEDQLAFIDSWLCLGDLAHERGDMDTMLRGYTIAYSDLIQRGIDGFGSQGSAGYAITGYQRFGRITDYLSEVFIPDITPDQIPQFRALAQAVAASGNSNTAREIYQHILAGNPDAAEIKTALANER